MQTDTRARRFDLRGGWCSGGLAAAAARTPTGVLSITTPFGAEATPTGKHGEDPTTTAT